MQVRISQLQMEGDFAMASRDGRIHRDIVPNLSTKDGLGTRPAGAICSEFAKAAYAAIVEGEFVVSLLQPAMA